MTQPLSVRAKEAYGVIAGNLLHMPNKKWKTLAAYRIIYSFVKNFDIKQQIINFNLSFDYQLSLYNAHKPIGHLEEMSFLCVSYFAGSICEALLKDLYFFKLSANPDKKFATAFLDYRKTKMCMFSDLLETFKPILKTEDYTYLDSMRKLRNTIHINAENKTIKVLEDTGHIRTERTMDIFLDAYINKKVFDFDKLEKNFLRFIQDFKAYY